jgi:anti-sigma factor RsiW
MSTHPLDRIGTYADGELHGAEAAALDAHLRNCTECSRELALIRTMGGIMRNAVESAAPRRSVWDAVHRRISRPVGWLLLAAGLATWIALGTIQWFRVRELTPEWLALTAVGIGLALLAVGVAYEQYREWKETRYKDIQQ